LALLAVLAVGSLTGCVSTSGDYSSTCKYKRKSTSSGFYCNTRPQPSAALSARAMAPNTVPRALAVFKKTHRRKRLFSVGLNHWGETTFAYGHDKFHPKLTTYDIDDRATSGDDGYVFDADDPINLGDADPAVLARALAAARRGNPDATFVSAVINHGPFSDVPEWRLDVTAKNAKNDLLYRVAADGSHLCHGTDQHAGDDLAPAAGVPACPDNVTPIGYETSR
jgi:hypothetical protein